MRGNSARQRARWRSEQIRWIGVAVGSRGRSVFVL